MNASRFIARRIRFKGKIAMVSIAISFLIMILGVAIASGFRNEIRKGVSAITGDVQLTTVDMNYISETSPIPTKPSGYDQLVSTHGVKSITPVVYRAGIVKCKDVIHGVMVKGIPQKDSLPPLSVSIPQRLAKMLGLKAGDKMLTYFVGGSVKVRQFRIASIYDSILDSDDNMIVYADISDLQRLNGWTPDQASAIEIGLDTKYGNPVQMNAMADKIGSIFLLNAKENEPSLVASSAVNRYPQFFDWLDLLDFNVLFILILMTIVAGFNMISGLLIMLFENISTIGTLKAMGMTDRAISKVFLNVSSELVLKGMLIGNFLAFLFCLVQSATHFIHLNPENYFVSFVPVHLDMGLIIVADIVAYFAIMLLLLIPTLFISKVDPAETVKTR